MTGSQPALNASTAATPAKTRSARRFSPDLLLVTVRFEFVRLNDPT
jgi:hypothetical protein